MSLYSGIEISGNSRVHLGDSYTVNLQEKKDTAATVLQACKSALFLTDPVTDREATISLKGERVGGTCEWVRDSTQYTSWLKGDAGPLCVTGSPGKGKTMLSIFLTQQLEKTAKPTDVVFFLFNNEDEKRNNAVALLRALLYQLLEKHPVLAKNLNEYQESPEKFAQVVKSREMLWGLFVKMARDEDRRLYCLIDGLDECEEESRSWLLPKLLHLAGQETPSEHHTFSLMILTRQVPGLERCTRMSLDTEYAEHVARDVTVFVERRLQSLPTLEGMTVSTHTNVRQQILARAESTFLWAGFVVNEALTKVTISDLMEALHSMPKGLPGLYERILCGIAPQHRVLASAALRWTALAFRPLRLSELAEAIEMQSQATISKTQAIRDLVAACGPILSIQNDKAVLIHHSARDYLMRLQFDGDPVLEMFRIKSGEAHLGIAWRCLSCIVDSGLLHRQVQPYRSSGPIKVPQGPHDNVLLPYACQYFLEHANLESIFFEKLATHPSEFFHDDPRLRQAFWQITGNREREKPSMLTMASYWGVVPWVHTILLRPKKKSPLRWLHDKSTKLGTADDSLAAAVWRGNTEVVNILVEHGVDVNAIDRDTDPALSIAAHFGHQKIVEILLRRNADPNLKGRKLSSLHSAIVGGNADIVRQLLDFGARLESCDSLSPLTKACTLGNEDIVQLLIDRGADLESTDFFYQRPGRVIMCTPLMTAVVHGHKDVVNLLLARGAEVRPTKTGGFEPLHFAVAKDELSMVLALLAYGSDANAECGPLASTCRPIHLVGTTRTDDTRSIIRSLVRKGADVNAQDGRGRTALWFAAYDGDEETVKLLLELGADRDLPGRLHAELCAETPLAVATWKAKEGIGIGMGSIQHEEHYLRRWRVIRELRAVQQSESHELQLPSRPSRSTKVVFA